LNNSYFVALYISWRILDWNSIMNTASNFLQNWVQFFSNFYLPYSIFALGVKRVLLLRVIGMNVDLQLDQIHIANITPNTQVQTYLFLPYANRLIIQLIQFTWLDYLHSPLEVLTAPGTVGCTSPYAGTRREPKTVHNNKQRNEQILITTA